MLLPEQSLPIDDSAKRTDPMPVFTKGSFNINLGLVSIGGEIDETDRQCAWELYCELVSRVAVIGKLDKDNRQVFVGERYDQSLDSLHAFFKEARGLMRRYPVGRIGRDAPENHLGFFIAALLETIVRPFLEKWQASYRHWWERARARAPGAPPFEVQNGYPRLAELQQDWAALRTFCREAALELTQTFALPDVTAVAAPEMKQAWLQETATVVADPRNG
jgi:hypothetical protein